MFHCEENNFQSNLNPKEIYFIFSSSFLAFLCFTLTEISIVCCLQFQCNCWNVYLLFQHDGVYSVFVKSTQTGMVLRERTWVNSLSFVRLFSLFVVLLSSFSCFCSHRKVWNVQYRILQSMQAKNCGTLFSVYGICKCTGRNYLYFSNVISLI